MPPPNNMSSERQINIMAGTQAGLLSLNNDVLSAIVSYLDSSSALQLSYTASSVHTIARHRALQSVSFNSIENAIVFFNFMLDKAPHRLFALHELCLRCEVYTTFTRNYPQRPHPKSFYADAASLLARLLRGAVKLRSLVMYSAEAWMDHEPDIVDVLSRIRTLKEVEFGTSGPHTSDFLHKMQSTPDKLMLCAPHFDPNNPHWRLVLNPGLSFPSVSTLSMIDALSHHFPGPDELARAFPNVKVFNVSRKQPRLNSALPIITWPTLERVRGTVGSLQGWTIGSSVHLMDVAGYLSCSKSGRLRAVRNTIFSNFSPSCIAANSIVAKLQPVAFIVKLEVAKEPEHVEQSLFSSSIRLRYLAITFDLVEGPVAENWWDTFCHFIAESNIVCLELRLVLDAVHGQTPGDTSLNPPVLERDTYEQLLLRALEAARNIPSSHRYVSFVVVSDGDASFPWGYDFFYRAHGHQAPIPPGLHWWSVEQTGHREARPLEAHKGRRIAEYLRSAKYNCRKPFDERHVGGL